MTLIAGGLASQEQAGIDHPGMRLITHPWIVWLGGASYVLFLIHNMLLRVWDGVLPLTPWQVPLITVAVVLVAALGYQFWERPVLAFARRKWLGRE
jgi:peptidoglycan/LPS O-acetylase OafA/YrhL